MLDKLKIIYNFIPYHKFPFLKYIPDRILFGKNYKHFKEKVSYNSINFKINLLNVMNYARRHTKYGREVIPDAITLENVIPCYESLPAISSNDVSTAPNDFASDEYSSIDSYLTTTGGTGRNPSQILLSNESYGLEWAHMLSIWEKIGYRKSKHCKLTLRGQHVHKSALTRYNPIYNEIIVDTFRLQNLNFDQFLEEIKNHNISYIHAYPSLLKEFMEYLKRRNLSFNIDGIMLGSEGATVEEKKAFSDFFSCNIVHWYGQTEKVVLADEVDGKGTFCCFSSYGYPDIYNGDTDYFGEIIGTTFVNKAMPLIKYRTGDFGSLIIKDGYTYLRNIQGRWGKDFLYASKEKKIPTSSINLHSEIQKDILFFQIHQKDFSKIHIKILPRNNPSVGDEKLERIVKKEIHDKLPDFHITSEIVKNENEIARSERGKMMMLVQEIQNNK